MNHFYEGKNSKNMYVADYTVFGKVLNEASENIIDIYRENDEDYFSIGFENVQTIETDSIRMSSYINAFLPWLLEESPS
ncbi:hypothetical protein WAK64_18185 [Bacillus spongiae]|uniref:Uncharacterized protein n=1 Tax=Bacillus spongiae TaxID=2683610 RepID=A0ABU8HIL2_9BACI